MGYWAYIAIYDKAHCDPIYKKLARWVNNRFVFGVCETFEDYLKYSEAGTPEKIEMTLSLF